jgi:hypothetical protein
MNSRRAATWTGLSLGGLFVLLFCAGMGLLGAGYGRPLILLAFTKWHFRNSPEIWIVPTPLPTAAIERTPGRIFSYFGYQFESPWTDIKQERKGDAIVVVNFSNGAVISIANPEQSFNELATLNADAVKQGVPLKDVFVGDAINSRYGLRSYELNLTPRDLRWFSSKREMVMNSILLVFKGISAPRYQSGLYTFQTDWFRGFQEGDPVKAKIVVIDVFDDKDQSLELMVGAAPNSIKVSQSDVNRVIYSLRPVPATPPK